MGCNIVTGLELFVLAALRLTNRILLAKISYANYSSSLLPTFRACEKAGIVHQTSMEHLLKDNNALSFKTRLLI